MSWLLLPYYFRILYLIYLFIYFYHYLFIYFYVHLLVHPFTCLSTILVPYIFNMLFLLWLYNEQSTWPTACLPRYLHHFDDISLHQSYTPQSRLISLYDCFCVSYLAPNKVKLTLIRFWKDIVKWSVRCSKILGKQYLTLLKIM